MQFDARQLCVLGGVEQELRLNAAARPGGECVNATVLLDDTSSAPVQLGTAVYRIV